VRGSIPAPGPDTNRYGGNTSCVSVTTATGQLIIIDMGTGLMHLGNTCWRASSARAAAAATILLSHAHWDHIQGLGFFAPVFIPGNRKFELRGHGRSSAMLEGILEGQMNPNFSPLYTLKNLGATFDVRAVVPGEPFTAGGVRSPRSPTRTARPPRWRSASRSAASALRLRLRRRLRRRRPDRPRSARCTAAPTRCSTTPPTRRPIRPAASPRLLVVRAGRRRRHRRRGRAAWSRSTTIRTTATPTSTRSPPPAARTSTPTAAPPSSSSPPPRAASCRCSGPARVRVGTP
jgi:hypothetical protein